MTTEGDDMLKGVVGASIGAIAGALIWGGIAYGTGYEVGFVAWGIGALVGGIAAASGEQSFRMGVICSFLTLASIFAGKMLAVSWVVHSEQEKALAQLEGLINEELHDLQCAESADLAQLESEADYPHFMIENEYTDAETAEMIPAEELTYFQDETAPFLRRIHAEKPTYEEWREEQLENMRTTMSSSVGSNDLAQAVMKNIGPIDGLFAVLGLFSAYRLASGE